MKIKEPARKPRGCGARIGRHLLMKNVDLATKPLGAYQFSWVLSF